MDSSQFETVLDKVVAADPRYTRDAYLFLREALDYTQKAIAKANKGETRHVTGQELLAGIRTFAVSQYGPMTLDLFDAWGVRNCEDFGEIVFNLIDAGVLGKREEDTRADFAGGYSFHEAFRKPFLPSSPNSGSRRPPESKA